MRNCRDTQKPRIKMKKMSSFKKFLIAYMLVVVVTIGMLVPAYYKMFRVIQSNTVAETRNNLNQGFRLLDNELMTINSLSIQMRANSTFYHVKTLNELTQTSDHYLILQLSQYFTDLTASLSLSEECMVWFSNDIFLMRKRVLSTPEQDISQFFHPGSDELDEFKQMVFSRNFSNQLMKMDSGIYLFDRNTIFNGFMLFITISTQKNGAPDAVFMAAFDADKILSVLGLDSIRNIANITLLDSISGTVLYSSSNIPQNNYKNIEYIEKSSSATGLKVHVEVPQSYYNEQLHPLFEMLYLYLLLALFILIVLSLIMAYRNTLPIRHIVSQLDSKNMNKGQKDDFQYIHSAISELNENNKNYQIQNHELNNTISELILLEQIQNGLDDAKLAQLERQLNDFPLPCYLIVMQVRPSQNFDYFNILWTMLSDEALKCTTLLRVKSNVYVTFFHGWAPNDEFSAVEQLSNALQDFAVRFQQNQHDNLFLSVSKRCDRLRDFPTAFRMCSENLRYLDFQRIIFADHLSTPSSAESIHIDLQENIRLGELILAGNTFSAKQVIYRQWYDVSISTINASTTELLFYLHCAVLLHAAAKAGVPSTLPAYDSSKSITEIGLELADAAEKLCDYINQRHNGKSEIIAKQIIDYIDAHYCDSTFYLVDLTDHFSLSDKTISRLIKEYTGKNFSDYIEPLRLKKALELLENPNLSVNEIAILSGFGLQNTLYKAFKRVYGVSPTTYREHMNKTNT